MALSITYRFIIITILIWTCEILHAQVTCTINNKGGVFNVQGDVKVGFHGKVLNNGNMNIKSSKISFHQKIHNTDTLMLSGDNSLLEFNDTIELADYAHIHLMGGGDVKLQSKTAVDGLNANSKSGLKNYIGDQGTRVWFNVDSNWSSTNLPYFAENDSLVFISFSTDSLLNKSNTGLPSYIIVTNLLTDSLKSNKPIELPELLSPTAVDNKDYVLNRFWKFEQVNLDSLGDVSVNLRYTNRDFEGAEVVEQDTLVLQYWSGNRWNKSDSLSRDSSLRLFTISLNNELLNSYLIFSDKNNLLSEYEIIQTYKQIDYFNSSFAPSGETIVKLYPSGGVPPYRFVWEDFSVIDSSDWTYLVDSTFFGQSVHQDSVWQYYESNIVSGEKRDSIKALTKGTYDVQIIDSIGFVENLTLEIGERIPFILTNDISVNNDSVIKINEDDVFNSDWNNGAIVSLIPIDSLDEGAAYFSLINDEDELLIGYRTRGFIDEFSFDRINFPVGYKTDNYFYVYIKESKLHWWVTDGISEAFYDITSQDRITVEKRQTSIQVFVDNLLVGTREISQTSESYYFLTRIKSNNGGLKNFSAVKF